MSRLHASDEVAALGHLGAIYLYHQRYGTILEMSADVYELWAAFRGGAERAEVESAFAARLSGQTPGELIDIFSDMRCLVAELGGERVRAMMQVPVKSAWNVWHDVGGEVVLWTAWGARPATAHYLDSRESAIWRRIDGERSAAALAGEHGGEAVSALLWKLSSLEIQAIKLSPVPLSVFGGAHRIPPYLKSTMPYPPLRAAGNGVPELGAYHNEIADPDAQFDDVETTLAHLFRLPHSALDGRTYGEALYAALSRRGLADRSPLRVLEIGGGLGEIAASFIEAADKAGRALEYRIIELSPALAARQRERTGGRAVVTVGDVLAQDIEARSVDLVIANEMIGDLAVAPLSAARDVAGFYALDIEGATDETPINVGAIELIERLSGWLADGGLGFVSEFGDRAAFARLSSHLDHPEHSIHFGHLGSAAAARGLASEFVFVIDEIEMRRDAFGLATTRSQFRALRALLASHGIALEKIGMTREMFEALTASIPGTFGDVRYDKIEDRLMGLVPHEFKALILRRA